MGPDLNEVFREVTIRITGEPDIAQAMQQTLRYLRRHLPLDEIFVIGTGADTPEDFMLLRVNSEDSTIDQRLFPKQFGEDPLELRRRVFERLPSTFVVRVEEIAGIADIEEVKRVKMKELNLAADASILVLGVRDMQAAVVFVCNRPDAFSDGDIELLEFVKEPLLIALSNAIHVYMVEQKRDQARDDMAVFEQVTRRITGKLDISEALRDTLAYMKTVMPVDEIVLYRLESRSGGLHALIRVNGDGVIGEPDRLLFRVSGWEKGEVLRERSNVKPPVFVASRDDLPKLDTRFEEFEHLLDGSFIVLNDFSLGAGMAFACRLPGVYDESHVRLLTMLREPLVIALSNALRYHELERLKDRLADDNRALLSEIRTAAGDRVVGADGGLRPVMSMVEQVARTTSPVLLLGETGTGKEVVATAIHRASDHAGGPLVSLNCGAVPETLLDSELFGHEKGAFTGALEQKRGKFERADGGTLFLDEIGELPPSAQVKLLRVLQSKEFERVGGTQTIRADVRLIAATHRDLPLMVREGSFREDLWFRLNVFPIQIPPLRERREDIAPLAYHFIETKSREMNLPTRPPLPSAELARLVEYEWPGNVRELQNAIERALILSQGKPLSFPLLSTPSQELRTGPSPGAMAPMKLEIRPLDEVIAEHLAKAVEAANGRISGPGGAADLVGLNPSTFRSKMKKLGLVHVRRGEIRKSG